MVVLKNKMHNGKYFNHNIVIAEQTTFRNILRRFLQVSLTAMSGWSCRSVFLSGLDRIAPRTGWSAEIQKGNRKNDTCEIR